MINAKYNHKSMALLNTMGTVINNFHVDRQNCTGRFKHLQIGKAATLTGIKLVAYGITLLVVFPFEKLLEPYTRYKYQTLKKTQVIKDLKEYTDKGNDVNKLKDEVRKFISDEGLFPRDSKTTEELTKLSVEERKKYDEKLKKHDEKREKYVDRAAATYASSRLHYAPVVVDWVHSILETSINFNKFNSANTTTKKSTIASDLPTRIVFLARDGIPAYKVAQILIAKHAKYANVPVSLLYISRKVKDWAEADFKNRAMLVEYAKQQGIQPGQKCLFIDIGFFGSMIEPIKNIFKGLTRDIEFGYLVSHTQNAHGFMANLEHKLGSVESAGQNRAVHWLEDTHQGVINSPCELQRKTDGSIEPSFADKNGEETCKSSKPKSYLYKHFGMKALIDGCEDATEETDYLKATVDDPRAWKMASEERKKRFDTFLTEYFNGQRISYAAHF